MSAADFLVAAKNPELIHDLAPDAKTLEGFSVPRPTYNLPRRSSGQRIDGRDGEKNLKRNGRASARRRRLPRPAALTEHLVTLASLVERETPKPEERPLVAGIFENRLGKKYAFCSATRR